MTITMFISVIVFPIIFMVNQPTLICVHGTCIFGVHVVQLNDELRLKQHVRGYRLRIKHQHETSMKLTYI